MSIDWTAGMTQTFELVAVDAGTWTETGAVDLLEGATIAREDEGTRVSVDLDLGGELAQGYYRLYLIAEQDGEGERVALATFLVTSCARSYDGRRSTWTATGYSPLVELESDMPPIGWSVADLDDATGVESWCRTIVGAHCRAPLGTVESGSDAVQATWVAGDDETWLDTLEGLLALASLHVTVDPLGRIGFARDADLAECSPSVAFGDGGDGVACVLHPDLAIETETEDVPNVVEVVYSNDSVGCSCRATDDSDAPTSTASRGYTVLYRETDPDLSDGLTAATVEQAVQDYADDLLAELTARTVTLSYSHGFVPDVDVGSVVRLEYGAAGWRGNAVVTAQTIECRPGLAVEETAELGEE